MTLALTAVKGSVTFTYTDDNMTASWTVKAEDGEEKLLSTMKRVIDFAEAQTGAEPLPQRIPGMALGMAQTAHPAPPAPANGWAAMAHMEPVPDIPERLQGEVELIPPEEQG